jgi:hypothetical protein
VNRKPTKRKTAKKPAAVIAPKALGHGEVSFGNLDARTIHVRDSRTGEIVGTLGDGGNTESLIIFDRTTGKPLVRMTKDGMFSLVGDCCFDFPHCISEALSHEGIPTPPDLERAVDFYVSLEEELIEKRTASAQQPGTDPTRGTIRKSLEECFRHGFMLAMLTYADELKIAPEGLSIRERMDRGRKKGAAATHKKAAPQHKAICKRFQELRKTIPKATARYLRIGREFGMDEGSVGRIVRKYNG